MRTSVKWIIAAVIVFILGFVIIIGGFAMSGFNFEKISNVKYETNTYELSENFNNIKINAATSDIVFVRYEEDNAKVVCFESEAEKHTVTVKDNTLSIDKIKTEQSWVNKLFSFNFKNPKITVYLPFSDYIDLSITTSTGDVKIPQNLNFKSVNVSGSTSEVKFAASVWGTLKIKLSTGDVVIDRISAGSVDIQTTTGDVNIYSTNCGENDVKITVTTGDVRVSGINCKNFSSDGSTGDVNLKNVRAIEAITIKRGTGDVIFDESDAASIYVKTTTGDVTGTLLSEKKFVTHSTSGDIKVPSSSSGGICEIDVTTGDISISIK